MSLEAVKTVTLAEQEAKERKAQAAVDARKLVAQAEKAGAQTVADAQARGRSESAGELAQAEARAAEYLAQVIRDTEGTCDELRAQAQGRLEQAADLIVRRVVDA